MIFLKKHILLYSETPYRVKGNRGTDLKLPAGFSSFENTGEDFTIPNTVTASDSDFPVTVSFFFERIKEILSRLSDIESYSGEIAESLNGVIDNLTDSIFPRLETLENGSDFKVGKIYVQYPNEPTPWAYFSDIKTNWAELFGTEGIFFRTSGGKASAFNSGIQEHALQFHEHGIPTSLDDAAGGNNDIGRNLNQYNDTFGIISSSGHEAVRTAEETRPRNRTFRIWKKIS